MSATSSVFFKLFIIAFYYLLPFCSGSTISHINSNHNNNNGVTEWQRNLEAHISRLGGRMDQLELRVGRVQSLVQMRFDNIENVSVPIGSFNIPIKLYHPPKDKVLNVTIHHTIPSA